MASDPCSVDSVVLGPELDVVRLNGDLCVSVVDEPEMYTVEDHEIFRSES